MIDVKTPEEQLFERLAGSWGCRDRYQRETERAWEVHALPGWKNQAKAEGHEGKKRNGHQEALKNEVPYLINKEI